MLAIASFAIATTSLLVSIVSFLADNKVHPRVRITLGIPFLVLAIVFGFFGLSSVFGTVPLSAPPIISSETPTPIPPQTISYETPTFMPTPTISSKTPTSLPPQSITNIQFVVDANKPWQHTGVVVQSGDLLEVTYLSGQWTGKSSVGGLSGPDFGPAPENTESCYPIRGEGSSLIGEIGAGTPFKIGYQLIWTAQVSGELLLRMNDCDQYLFDNVGNITVNIQQSR